MSPAERRALTMVLALGVAGHLVRSVTGRDGPPAPAVVLFDPASDGDPLAHRDSSRALAAPLAEGEWIDIDRAAAGQLTRLPGVGPAMAQRIIADRQKHGAFGGISALERVPGIGPATAARLAPHLRFSNSMADPMVIQSSSALSLNQATAADLERLPGIGTRRAREIVAFRDSVGPFRTVEELRRVPGLPGSVIDRIGPMVRLP